MFEKILLSYVYKLIEERLAQLAPCKNEDCETRQFIRQVKKIILSDKSNDKKNIDKTMELL